MTPLRISTLLGLLTLVPSAATAQRTLPRLVPAAPPAELRILEFDAASVTWADDSTLVLIDSDVKQVVTIGTRSGVLRRIGREGSGPGEFRFPTGLLAAGGELLVADIGTRRVSRFDGQRRYSGSAITPGPTLQLFGVSGGRLRLAWLDFRPTAEGPVVGEIDLASGKTTPLFAVLARDSTLRVRTDGMPGPNPFVALAGGPGGTVVAASPQTYRVTVFDRSGRRVRSFGRDLRPQFRTDAEIESIVARSGRSLRSVGAAEAPGSDPVEALRRTLRKQPKPHFPMGGMAVDADGRLWIATSRGGSATELDVFAADGTFLGTLPLAGRVSAIAIRPGWLAALTERTSGDDEGFQGIDLYRIGGP